MNVEVIVWLGTLDLVDQCWFLQFQLLQVDSEDCLNLAACSEEILLLREHYHLLPSEGKRPHFPAFWASQQAFQSILSYSQWIYRGQCELHQLIWSSISNSLESSHPSLLSTLWSSGPFQQRPYGFIDPVRCAGYDQSASLSLSHLSYHRPN